MTNETEYFNEFEESYYKENISQNEKKKMQYTSQHRITKVLNKSLVKSDSSQPKFNSKLTEYDILRKLIKLFQLKNFSKVSYVLGGYKDVHNLGLQYQNINLIEHESQSCELCLYNINNSKSIKKTSSTSNLDSSRYSSMTNPKSKSRKNSLCLTEKYSMGQKLDKNQIKDLLNRSDTFSYICFFIEFKVANSKPIGLKCPETGSPSLSILLHNCILILNLSNSKHDVSKHHTQPLTLTDWLESTDEFPIYEIIENENLSNILTKKMKNIVTMDYITTVPGKKTPQTKTVVLDFKKDTDSKDFITTIKKKLAI